MLAPAGGSAGVTKTLTFAPESKPESFTTIFAGLVPNVALTIEGADTGSAVTVPVLMLTAEEAAVVLFCDN